MKTADPFQRLSSSETRRLRPLTLWLPVAMLAAYLLGMILVPIIPWTSPFGYGHHRCLIMSELGIIENATALFFLLAGVMAFRLAWKLRGQVRRIYLACYVLFALASVFVCLEEINYGQFYFGFETPEAIRERSTQFRPVPQDDDADDTEPVVMQDLAFNLHNLAGNKPARRLNLLATVGFPIWCIILPLAVVRLRPQKAWTPGHWTRYLLPGLQLTLIVIIAQSLSWLDDLYVWLLELSQWGAEGGADMGWPASTLIAGLNLLLDQMMREDNNWYRASEFKELYWSLAALTYILILSRRLLAKPSSKSPHQKQKTLVGEKSADFSACL